MSKQLMDYILSAIALVAILGFTVLYGAAIVGAWTASDTAPTYGNSFQYLATALCGLVGGITAKGLGQPYVQATPGSATIQEEPSSRLKKRMVAFGSMLAPIDSHKVRSVIAAIYTIVFLFFGITAAITWVLKEVYCPEMVKNLAMISLGLIIPSLQGFFTADSKPENQ